MTTPTPPTMGAELPTLTDDQWYDIASAHANREWNSDGYLESIKAVGLAAIAADRASASRAMPEGWVCVPREPTDAMVAEVEEAARLGGIWTAASVYRAMIAAAPPAGALTVLQPSVAVKFGPWSTNDIGNALYAAGFEHDLRLELSGYFASKAERLACAQQLVEHLNTPLTANQAAEAPPVAVEATKAVAALELAREALDPAMPGRVSYAQENRIRQDARAAIDAALATPATASEEPK